MVDEKLTIEDLKEAWPLLSADERAEGLRNLPHGVAQSYFVNLSADDQAQFLAEIPPWERLSWLRQLPPDDAADLLQAVAPEVRRELLGELDDRSRSEIVALMAYAEDDAGGLMSPRYARLRAEMTVDEAIHYLRRQATQKLETLYYAYVLDSGQRLTGVVSVHELFAAKADRKVSEVMRTEVITVLDDADQEAVARTIAENDLLAVPVVDAEGRMRGIVTFDDVADVLREENTEDIQKLAAVEVLGAPYLRVGILEMVKKRGGWLAILFLTQMLTTYAMERYQGEIEKAVLLALFVPLIISAGGNSGSQATTLVIRALALGELRPQDFLRVVRRELAVGVLLGAGLGVVGMLRIGGAQALFGDFGEHWLRFAFVVFLSVLGVVTCGSLVGALLPFVLRRVGLDPASASAPFVATLVDVTGVVIYFNVAWMVLRGTLL